MKIPENHLKSERILMITLIKYQNDVIKKFCIIIRVKVILINSIIIKYEFEK